MGHKLQATLHAEPTRRADDTWRTMTAYVSLAVLWISTHPYVGLVHDARLYAVQALHRLDPQRFAEDLYFAFGSQDSFTVFSAIYAPLVGTFGSSTAHALLTVFGHVLWISSLLWLTRTLFGPTRAALLATAAAIVLNPHYGGLGLFGYAEPFATPRVFAEAFVMLALAGALRGQRVLAVGALMLGGAFHPLMALPGMALVFLVLANRDRRLWWALAPLAGATVVLVMVGVEPFGRATRFVDDEWFSIMLERVPYVLLSH
jgi:hypothetical protein